MEIQSDHCALLTTVNHIYFVTRMPATLDGNIPDESCDDYAVFFFLMYYYISLLVGKELNSSHLIYQVIPKFGKFAFNTIVKLS